MIEILESGKSFSNISMNGLMLLASIEFPIDKISRVWRTYNNSRIKIRNNFYQINLI